MFSEYASRFLAQSQSRISNFVQPENNNDSPLRNNRRGSNLGRGQNRGYAQRSTFGNPYQPSASHLSNFPFASRLSAAPDAPLFHSALDEFREEDDEEERERDMSDFYALQRSRRVFGESRMEESSETDQDGSNASIENSKEDDGRSTKDRGRGRGIKSSWNGGIRSTRGRGQPPETVGEEPESVTRHSSEGSSNGKGKMVDVGLESTIADSEPPEDLATERFEEDSPPAFQQFRSPPKNEALQIDAESQEDIKHPVDLESGRRVTRTQSIETVPPTVPTMMGEPPWHDLFWGSVYLICLAALFATFFLIFLHTSTPNSKLGDTIYTTLHASFHLLAVDTVVAVIVSLIWLALLKSFVRPLVYLILISVPIILISFSLYPLISSYHGTETRTGIQDRVMRWLSFVPAISAALWLFTIYKGRNSLTKAIGILEFSSRILASNPALLPLGFATLVAVIIWTWIWLGMFTRVFLGGHFSAAKSLFVIDLTTWWLGVFFVMMYLWTLAILSGIQRATTAATVSQWYFHRSAENSPSSRDIVQAALTHSTTIIFGTISLSTMLALLIRLPILVLPRRLMGAVSIFAYSFIPTPVATLINPLTLTYAAIQSQPLNMSARALSQMSFLGPQAPTTSLTPRSFSSRTNATPLLPYRLAKLLLHATRYIMAIGLGFGGWVATAKQLEIALPGGAGFRGSAYAYVVGLVASFIGWGVLGAIENVLSGIVDATVVCWGVEKGTPGNGYSLDAAFLFGDGRDRDSDY